MRGITIARMRMFLRSLRRLPVRDGFIRSTQTLPKMGKSITLPSRLGELWVTIANFRAGE
jgi:hypothetical protein